MAFMASLRDAEKDKKRALSYHASDFVVVHVHRFPRPILLPARGHVVSLACIDKLAREPVSVLGIVTASSPVLSTRKMLK